MRCAGETPLDLMKCTISGVLSLALLPGVAVASSPPADVDPAVSTSVPESEDADDAALRERQALVRARELFAAGQISFDAKEYTKAIESWKEAYDIVSHCERGQLFAPLASAYWGAYLVGQDEQHLLQAKKMFDRHLETLSALSEEAQAETEAQIAEIEAELERLESERLQRAREQAAREAVEYQRALRQQEDLELRKARLRDETRRFGIHARVGGSLIAVGVVSWSMTAAGLGLGARVDRRGALLFVNSGARPEEFRALADQGRAYNRLAVSAGILGSALVISGAAMLIVATTRLKRAKRQVHVPFSAVRAGQGRRS